jgi:hypothetical protein
MFCGEREIHGLDAQRGAPFCAIAGRHQGVGLTEVRSLPSHAVLGLEESEIKKSPGVR